MKMTGAMAMVKSLEEEKVQMLFGYPGAAICPFYDALIESPIKHVLTRHEQGAAHAANGYARITGHVGVCVATSGPGATNLITGIATAYMDSIAMVVITGQVSSELIGRDVFQEADITGSTAPFSEHSYLVKNAKDLPRVFKEAFYIASTGRPGPVLMDIPMDIQKQVIDFEYPKTVNIAGYKPRFLGHQIQIQRIAKAISEAERPVVCCGGGIMSARAWSELKIFLEKTKIPVVHTLMGKGAVPFECDHHFGMIGSHGVYSANYAVNHADLLILMGARVGDRAIQSSNKLAQKMKIIHIDIDPAEIGKNMEVHIPVVGDLNYILAELNKILEPGNFVNWQSSIIQAKMNCLKRPVEKAENISPAVLFETLSSLIADDAIIATEVGQNQIWAANHTVIRKQQRFLTSGGLGTMGYGLPAAVGAKLARPDCTVIAVAGDGSFQMSMQELGTIKQEKLDIKIIILNNQRLGMVRELQKNQYGGRCTAVFLEENPDFVMIAKAYGISGEKITENNQVPEALSRMLSSKGAYLLECMVDPDEGTLC